MLLAAVSSGLSLERLKTVKMTMFKRLLGSGAEHPKEKSPVAIGPDLSCEPGFRLGDLQYAARCGVVSAGRVASTGTGLRLPAPGLRGIAQGSFQGDPKGRNRKRRTCHCPCRDAPVGWICRAICRSPTKVLDLRSAAGTPLIQV